MSAEDPSNVPSAAHEPPPTDPSSPLAIVAREPRQDPLTGLPLLRYRFAGTPTLRPGDPAPDGAWRVLRVESRNGDTVLDLEMHAGATSADDHPATIDDDAAEAALATLADAADLGVAHGDLGAHRLWRRGQRTWIEGYGVPWRDGAHPADDARALAEALLSTPGTRLSASLRRRLEAVRDGGPPRGAEPTIDAPVAAPAPDTEIATHAELNPIPAIDAEPTPVPPPYGSAPGVGPDAALSEPSASEARSSAKAAKPKRTRSTPAKAKRSKPAAQSRPRTDEADPSPVAAVPLAPTAPAPPDPAPTAAEPQATTATPAPWAAATATAPTPEARERSTAGAPAPAQAPGTVRFVEGPPPGSVLRPGAVHPWSRLGRTLRAGIDTTRDLFARGRRGIGSPAETARWRSDDDGGGFTPRDGRRRAVLAVALVLSAMAWIALATLTQPRPVESALVSRVVGHVVEVVVEPAGLPPVSLVVVESPPGSRLAPGSVVASVPSKVLLDRDGVWRFQTRFGGVVAPTVVLVTPGESTLVVPFPTESPAAVR